MKKIIFVIFGLVVICTPGKVLAQSGDSNQPIQRTIIEENEGESFEQAKADSDSSKLVYAVIAIALVIGAGYVGKMLWKESKKDK